MLPALLCANTAPTVVIQSAAMRPGTTLMDVVYRVNDPDDATVKTRALAFIDGERSFAKVIKPVTFAEGTAAKLGDAIPSNTNHTITWDVAADWNIDLGQIKFEVLAMDGRGLLPFDWITIPAAEGNPALTISKDTPSDGAVLDAFLWQYADGDTGLTLSNGVLRGTTASGIFSGIDLANGATVNVYGTPFVYKRMNLDPASAIEIGYADSEARAGLLNTNAWHAANRTYAGITPLIAWGPGGLTKIPVGLTNVSAASVSRQGTHCLALSGDGNVFAWGNSGNGATTIPAGLKGVKSVVAGYYSGLALKSDGTVVGWGFNSNGQTTIPIGLTGVTEIKAGIYFSLALKSDGTVVGWGQNNSGQCTPPAGLNSAKAIAAANYTSVALKSDGTVVQWGQNPGGTAMPSGLSGVTAIAAGDGHILALKSNGTVVGWGNNGSGQVTIPTGLSGVTAIAAGSNFSLALKNDGTVVGWGNNGSGQVTIPTGLTGVTSISAGSMSIALKAKAP
jgi:hypothetical protein